MAGGRNVTGPGLGSRHPSAAARPTGRHGAAPGPRDATADWRRLDLLVHKAHGLRGLSGAEIAQLAGLYQTVCADAARARARGTDDETVQWLDAVIGRAHNALYRARPRALDPVGFLFVRFPAALRRHAQMFAICAALFYGTFLAALVAAWAMPGFAKAIAGPGAIEEFRQMYAKAPQEGRGLVEGLNGVAFYVQHNTSIAFRIFASGVFAGAGALYQLVYQGVVLGTVFGFLIADDKSSHILTFTCGHSAWELTAIVVAGTGGLRAGWAWVAPGTRTRLGSLRAARTDVAELVLGAAVMLAVAAAIEAVWSPSSMPPAWKWAFAVAQVAIVAVWLTGWRPARRGALE